MALAGPETGSSSEGYGLYPKLEEIEGFRSVTQLKPARIFA